MLLVVAASPRFVRAAIIFAVVAATAMVSVTPDASAARRRYKSSSSHYSPPQASIAVDGYSGKIIQSYKADEARYPASLTKVMTLYLLFEFLRKGRIALDTELAVTEYAASQSPTKLHLAVGETISVKDAMRALVTKSANDAAVAIAENLAGSEAAFARLMTMRARSLGMKNTTFRNASGLPHAEQRTTAYDLAVLARAILRDFPEHASLFQTKFFKYREKLYKNHNGLLFSYAGADGMKTGFTNASGFNLMTTARRDGKFLVAVMLGGRSSRARNESMRTLLNASWVRAKSKAEHEAGQLVAQRSRPAKAMAATALRIEPDSGAKSGTGGNRIGPFEVKEVSTKPASAQVESAPARVAAFTARPLTAPPAKAAPISISASVAIAGGAPRSNAASSLPHLEIAAKPASIDSNSAFPGPYHIQVGAYETPASAQLRLDAIMREAGDVVAGHPDFLTTGISSGRSVSRARFGAFTHTGASNACEALRMRAIDCVIVQN